jgi:hypothetical protein
MTPDRSPVELLSLAVVGEIREGQRWSHKVMAVQWTPKEAQRRASIAAGWTP